LKAFEELKAAASAKEEELKGAQTALAAAEAKVAEKDSEIATLTAERDDYKAKYEQAPAQVPAVEGIDEQVNADSDLKAMYAELEKMY